MEEADEGFSFAFGDFSFAPPQPHINGSGGLTSAASQDDNDDEWGDFFVAAPPPQPSLSNPNAAFSPPPQSHLNPKPSFYFDPFPADKLARPTADPSPSRPDPCSRSSGSHRGALPLSLFGEAENEPDSIGKRNKNDSNSSLDPNSNGKIEVKIVSNGGGFNINGDVFANFYAQTQQIKPEIKSGVSVSDSNNLDDGRDDEGDDEWEFRGAFSGNGLVKENEGQGASVQPGSESGAVMGQEKQAGQDALSSAEHNHGPNSLVPPCVDLFAACPGVFHKSNEIDVGLKNGSTTVNANGFTPNLFHGVELIITGFGFSASSVDEDDDFGDFVDASQEVGLQQLDQCIPGNAAALLPNGNIQDHQIQPENSRGPLPLDLFSDGLDEPSAGLTHQDETFHKPTSYPRNGVSTQGPRISIHDLLSNLYSQSQQTSSVDSNKKPAENGVHSPQKPEDSTPYDANDDWDGDSWEFKDASSERGIKEQSFGARTTSQKPSDATSNLQFYTDFYAKLTESLCILLSQQLNEEKKFQGSDTIGDNGKAEALHHGIQEAYKLLEGNITSEEYLPKKHLDRGHCLNGVLEALQGPECKVIELNYNLSERLQLATKDWRSASDLLKHAIAVLQIISLGSADEQSVYVSTWSKIISFCAQELKHGALIWKRASEKNVQAQILSDHRGQQNIQALGEIYKVVELLRLSTKFYNPWMLLSVSDPQELFGLLEECVSLWSGSGLEKALQNVSDYVGLGHTESAKALVASIKHIRNVDLLAVQDCVFVQRRSICRLSLLPQEILPDLKVALWNTEPYFLNLANLWANLISHNPPQLPLLQVS